MTRVRIVNPGTLHDLYADREVRLALDVPAILTPSNPANVWVEVRPSFRAGVEFDLNGYPSQWIRMTCICGCEVAYRESGLCESCETQKAYDEASADVTLAISRPAAILLADLVSHDLEVISSLLDLDGADPPYDLAEALRELRLAASSSAASPCSVASSGSRWDCAS